MIIDVFAEDRAHEEFFNAMLDRLAREHNKAIEKRIRSSRSGHGRVLEELSLYQRAVQAGVGGATVPDLLIVAVSPPNPGHRALSLRSKSKRTQPRFPPLGPLSERQ